MFGHTPQIGTQPVLLDSLPCYAAPSSFVLHTAYYGKPKVIPAQKGQINFRNSVPFNVNYRLEPPAVELPLQDSRDTYEIGPREMRQQASSFVQLPYELRPHAVTPLPAAPISTGGGAFQHTTGL